MSEISSLLNSLYANDQVSSLEKTAEDNLIAALRDEDQVEENPLANFSDDELIAMLQSAGSEKTASAGDETVEDDGDEEVPELLEKTAAEMLAGQVMAHAMVHEMGLIKEAMTNGLCRVCKENPFDVEGSSICSGCMGQESDEE